jgi:hypothetical protein
MIISRTLEKNSHTVEYTVRRSELLETLGLESEGTFTDVNSLALLGQYLESMEE